MAIYNTLDRERVAVNTAIGLTSAKVLAAGTIYARIQNVGDYTANYTTDGTTATALLGDLLYPGDIIEVWGTTDMSRFSIIKNATASAIEVTYCGKEGA